MALSAPARLRLLLPWLNGALDEHVYLPGERPEDAAIWTDYAAVRRAVDAFVESFDGSAEAGHLEVAEPDYPPSRRQPAVLPTDDELDDLAIALRILLAQGFGDGLMGDLKSLSFSAKSLGFAVRNARRQKPRWRSSLKGTRVLTGGAKALRDYRAAGAYVLQVHGAPGELVPFLAAHLLTQPDMVAVRHCARHRCEHFFVVALSARGRPQKFCSKACGVLNAEQLAEQVKQHRTHRRKK